MYTGSMRENLQRKGMCTDLTSNNRISTKDFQLYAFDELRKLAGTLPQTGKNNWYMTHGANLKGAFGEQVDEGYWMCLKPNSALAYPRVGGSHQVTHNVCPLSGATTTSVTVDFSDTFQFETEFLLSSESFTLMEKCTALGVNLPGDVSALDTAAPSLVLTRDEVSSEKAFSKLLEIQNYALSFVPHAHGIDMEMLHLGLFVHNNGGYRYPDTIHVPFRRIVEDTISGAVGNKAANKVSYNKRFAIVSAMLVAGEEADYNCSNATTSHREVMQRIGTCYEKQFNKGGDWYWGGKEKAEINVDREFYSFADTGEKVYGSVNEWQGGRSWFAKDYTSGYVGAATCLVEGGQIALDDLLLTMGCEAEKCAPVHCPDAPTPTKPPILRTDNNKVVVEPKASRGSDDNTAVIGGVVGGIIGTLVIVGACYFAIKQGKAPAQKPADTEKPSGCPVPIERIVDQLTT
jgi:hypothetical protein